MVLTLSPFIECLHTALVARSRSGGSTVGQA